MPDAAALYKQTALSTLTGPALVAKLFEGLGIFVRQAEQAGQNGDWEEAHRQLLRGEDILAVLRGTLDFHYEEVASGLDALYTFYYNRLVEADLHHDTGLLPEIQQFAEEWFETWQKVAHST